MEEAKKQGARLLSVVNVVGSQASRVADDVIYLHAGPEISVASTKAYAAMLVDLYLFAIYLGQRRGTLDAMRARTLLAEAFHLPTLVDAVLREEPKVRALAYRYQAAHNFLFLGRGVNYPTALEGALKLKELSYIHAEGTAAGEMKHGTNALLDEDLPVVAIALRDTEYKKIRPNREEGRAPAGVRAALDSEDGDGRDVVAAAAVRAGRPARGAPGPEPGTGPAALVPRGPAERVRAAARRRDRHELGGRRRHHRDGADPRRADAAREAFPRSRVYAVGAGVLPLERPAPRGTLGGEGGGLEGAWPRGAWRGLARDRDKAHAGGTADSHAARPGRSAPRGARPARTPLRLDLAHSRSRSRGRRGPALREGPGTPLTAAAVRAALRPLPRDAGKEARGRVVVVGGSLRYPGALLLAARAALRCGAGVVTVASARSVVEAIAGEDPNVTFFPLAEAQPGVIATGAAAQLTSGATEKTKALLLGP